MLCGSHCLPTHLHFFPIGIDDVILWSSMVCGHDMLGQELVVIIVTWTGDASLPLILRGEFGVVLESGKLYGPA